MYQHEHDCIERIGGIVDPPMEPIVGAENTYFYRNKAQFPVGTDKDGNPVIGFYRRHSHDVVNNPDCVIQAPVNGGIMKAFSEFMVENSLSSYNEETGNKMMCFHLEDATAYEIAVMGEGESLL